VSNRAERRKAGNKDKVRTYVLTDVQIQQIKNEATKEAFVELLAIPVQVLHDKFGFGQTRLDRFTHYALNWLEMVRDKEVTLAQLRKTLEDEAGIVIKEAGK
jgi:glycosylphosphatidylinositol transamidase (GPIT) subunit GPI8